MTKQVAKVEQDLVTVTNRIDKQAQLTNSLNMLEQESKRANNRINTMFDVLHNLM